jgi:hypothetical protein
MISARCFVPVIDRAIEDVEEGIEQAYYRKYCCKGASSDLVWETLTSQYETQ